MVFVNLLIVYLTEVLIFEKNNSRILLHEKEN